jgi:tetratricopeptide (TPR) repeat protein
VPYSAALWLIVECCDQLGSLAGGWVAGTDLVPWFVAEAVQAYGDRVLADADGMDAGGPEAVGRDLARLIFGGAEAGTAIPAPLGALIGRPGSSSAQLALYGYVEERLEADPGLASAAAGVLGRYYRQQLESGDGQGLADLGDLLWGDEPELARTAFEHAVDAGNRRALIRLATHRRLESGDYEGALALYQQAVASPEPGIAAEALAEMGDALRGHGDYQAARAAWEQCIATGNPDWAPHAMAMLASMLERKLGDRDGAVAMFQAAFDTGHPEVAPRAMLWIGLLLERTGDGDGAQAAYQRAADAALPGRRGTALWHLADLLHNRGDTAAAKAVWQQIIDTETDEGSPELALSSLVNQLGSEGDLDGLRAAYQAGTASGNPSAPDALVEIGNVLRGRGDLDGWREVWQQAIDAGYGFGDQLLEELSPLAEDDDDEPAEVPAGFDPRNMTRTGIAVLENGLPQLPEVLTRHMAVPMAYWAARETAVVLFLRFHRHRRTWQPIALKVTFTRLDGEWTADGTHWHGTDFHDPFTDPGGLHGLGGEPIVYSSTSDTIWHGTADASVKYLALIQDGHQDRRPLDNHFGAWIIRADKPGPFRVAAIDENGTTLAEIEPGFGRH